MSAGEVVLRVLLGLLAAYHIGMGAVAVVSPTYAGRLAGTFYGVSLSPAPQTQYVIRMLGLLAVAIGSLLTVAMLEPAGNRATIVVVAALQASRAACRILFADHLHRNLGLSRSRNALNAALLVAQAVLLLGLFPDSR